MVIPWKLEKKRGEKKCQEEKKKGSAEYTLETPLCDRYLNKCLKGTLVDSRGDIIEIISIGKIIQSISLQTENYIKVR